MNDIPSRFNALGIAVPEILLPRSGTDLFKWAVIACDQFTQDRAYWERVKAAADGGPSCLNLIFPEVYLEDGGAAGKDKKILEIRNAMNAYIAEGVFAPPRRCCVYLERSTPYHPKRRGVILAADLEHYNWTPESRPLIRSTEGTVTERLPPRMAIRRGSPLELPHIMLLVDDEDDALIPSLGALARKNPPLYESPLMMNSGAVTGWALDTDGAFAALASGLEALAEKSLGRYGGGASSGGKPFLFAAGDGNHSLAAARAVWEEYKTAHSGEAGLENHPARWALVEVENLYDPGLVFEPIHRVVFDVDGAELVKAVSALPGIGCYAERPGVYRLESALPDIATASLEPLLDSFVKEKGGTIDYIHGREEVFRLAEDPARPATGLILPPVKKEGLFKTVARTGPLPRKSFSMGEAEEKRFYLECRRLFG